MNFDLDLRRAHLSVGDLSDFSLGPQAASSGSGGLWRAQLGTRWHRELREQVLSEGAAAEFEVPVSGEMARKGWIVALAGRIDQVVLVGGRSILREIKTVTRALPVDEAQLRGDYPGYFVQLAAYAALRGSGEAGELVFVEADTGLAQTVALSPGDQRLLELQLDRVAPARARAAALPQVPPGLRGAAQRPGDRVRSADRRRPGRPGRGPP
jgi:DNA excision repair protein ERCC-2